MEKLVAQAEYLASQGVRELIVVAQETTVYGKDPLRRKISPHPASETLPDTGDPVDPYPLLLSGGNLSGTDPDYERRKEDLPLSGPSYPAL